MGIEYLIYFILQKYGLIENSVWENCKEAKNSGNAISLFWHTDTQILWKCLFPGTRHTLLAVMNSHWAEGA